MHLKQKAEDQPDNDLLTSAIEVIQKTIPLTAEREVTRGWKSNSEAKRSKFLKKPNLMLDTIVDFNAYLQAAIQQYEMAEHIYEKNMIEAYYYQTAMECIRENRGMPSMKLEEFRTKEFIFRVFPRFGKLKLIRIDLLPICSSDFECYTDSNIGNPVRICSIG